MIDSLVTLFKWIGYIIIAILLLACGIALITLFSVAGVAGLAVGSVFVVAFVVSHWNTPITLEDKKDPQ